MTVETFSVEDQVRTGEKVNLCDKLALINDHWNPRIVGALNGQHVKLVKFSGAFVWHQHEHEDELFLVVKGVLLMKLRDRDLWLHEGELAIIPHGVEHLPVAEGEVQVILLEPKTTVNTGDAQRDRTMTQLQRI